ncbi:MAG: cupin domain-containing protein [Gemmatimonadota bacterium]
MSEEKTPGVAERAGPTGGGVIVSEARRAGAGPDAEAPRATPGLDAAVAFAAAGSACGGAAVPVLDRSRVLRYDGAGWESVRPLPYRAGGGAARATDGIAGAAESDVGSADDVASFRGITRRVLASPAPAAFDVRYFEIERDGYSAFERHAHVHVVVCFRGRGRVRLGDEVHEVGYGDVVYVAPDEPHQFLNPYNEPFGFLCIVDRERDRPVPIGG